MYSRIAISNSKPNAISHGKMRFHHMLIGIIFYAAHVLTTPIAPDSASTEIVNSATNTPIDVTIKDHAGQNITSSFQIMLYYSPETSTNITTNKNLSNRQVTASRPLNECPGTAVFIRSYCTPEHDKPGSLQRYTIVCVHSTVIINDHEFPTENSLWLGFANAVGAVPVHRYTTTQRDGHCNDDEICVPGLGKERSRSGKVMASCVGTEYFVKYINWGENQRQSLDLEGKTASMVVSRLDGTTPVEVDTFEADTETTIGGAVQTRRCRDCMELQTDRFAADTEGLKLGTRLLTAGAMAGVLWLAIGSG